MNFYIVIPAYNEEAHIAKMLESVATQTLLPKKIVIVNDNSTDNTQAIINRFSEKYSYITSIQNSSKAEHQPGSKVVAAFYKGYSALDDDYDVICKFDADLILPKDYLEKIAATFQKNKNCGMAGGFCYIEKDKNWELESLTNNDHLRGAIKAYLKECFTQIGGLKESMGWDTVDELLAQFHGWDVITEPSLKVKHLKPTGKTYTKKAKHKQGEAFYKMRYGYKLTQLASLKLALKKRDFGYYFDCIQGYRQARKRRLPFLVSEKEGDFIRKLRWQNIKKKII